VVVKVASGVHPVCAGGQDYALMYGEESKAKNATNSQRIVGVFLLKRFIIKVNVKVKR